MGVAVLYLYPVPQDKTAPQVIDLLSKRLLNLGGKHTGQFLVDCEVYYSTQQALAPPPTAPNQPPQSRVLYVLHDSEHPATVFSVSDSGVGRPAFFACDNLFDLLLLKLSNVYSKRLRFECKGPRFEVGDFLVKIGAVSLAGSFRGVLVETEYQPCASLTSCWGLLSEFVRGFLGAVASPQIPPSIKVKADREHFTPIDKISQYLEKFNILRNAAQAQQQQQHQQPMQQRQ